MGAGNRFKTLQAAAAALARGEQMIVFVPSPEHAVICRKSLAAGGAAAELICAGLAGANGVQAAEAGKKAAARLPRRKFVAVELAGGDHAWLRKEADRLLFIGKLSAAFHRSGVKSVWIIARPLLSDAAAAGLKDEVKFFVDAFLSDRILFFQFLTAKGVFAPSFFLPRIARPDEPGIPLEQPSLPGSAPAGARPFLSAESSDVPQAVAAGARLVTCNAAFRARFTWHDAGSGKLTLRELFGKENAALVKQLAAPPADGPGEPLSVRGDVSIKAPDGVRLEFAVSASRMTWEGKAAWHLSLADMSGRNEAFRLLRESEESLQAVLNRQAGAVAVVQDGRFAFLNGACAALLGFASPGDLTGKEAVLPVAPRGRKEFLERLSPGVPGKAKPFTMEYAIKREDGSHRIIELRGDTILYAGRPAVVCFHADISERRAAEEELKRGEREHAILGQLSHAIHASLEPSGVAAAALRSAMRWLSFEQGGMYGLDEGGDTLTLTSREGLPESVAGALAVQQAQEGTTGLALKTAKPLLLNVAEYPPYLPYKTLFEAAGVKTVLYLPLVAGEEVNALMMLCSAKEAAAPARDEVLLENIARHAGDALANAFRYDSIRASELRYRSLVESVTDVVYEAAPGGAFRIVSAQAARLTGHAPDEFMRNPDLWRSLIHPDDRTGYARRISNREEGGEEFTLGYRLLPKGKAAYRHVRDAVRYRRDASGAVTSMSGIVSDVTEQVEAERIAASSMQAGGDTLQSMQEGVVVYDRELRYREWNRPMELLTGFTRDQVLGRNGLEGRPDFKLPDFPDLLHRALAGMPVSSEDIGYLRPGTKDPLVFWGRFSPLRNSAGEIEGVVGTITDVTHRKGLERELRESEETLRNVIDTLGDALMISDLQGKVWEVNREFTHLTGYNRSDVLGMTFPYPWLIEEQMARFLVWIAALREKKYLRDFDMTWKRQDGHQIAISINTTLLRNAAGEPVAMLNLARDISERHRLASELAGKGRQIEMLNRIISKANSTMEFPLIFDAIAEEVRELMPYDHMNVCLLNDDRRSMVIHASVGAEFPLPHAGEVIRLEECGAGRAIADRRSVVINDLAGLPESKRDILSARAGMRSEITIPIMLNERILGTLNVCSAAVAAFSGKELSYLQPIADQIGALLDRTELFQRVSDDSAYIHTLLNSIDSVVFTVDQGAVVRQANTAWRDFALLQGTPDLCDEAAVVGRPLGEVIRDGDLRNELTAVVPRLFDATLGEFSREFETGAGERVRSFQCAVAPMTINERVTSLVFTLTDITESKQTEAEIKRRNEELLALNAVASSINQSLELDEVLAVAAEQVKGLVRAEIVLCYLHDERDRLLLAAHLGLSERHASAIRVLSVEGSAAGGVIRERRPIAITGGLSDDPRLTAAGRAMFAELGAQSLIGIPLESKDRVLGALIVAFTRVHALSDQEQRVLMLIGNQLGAALENVRLYSEIQAQVRRITLLYEIGKGLTGTLDTRMILAVVRTELLKSIAFKSLYYFSIGRAGNLEVQFGPESGVAEEVGVGDPALLGAADGTPFAGTSANGTPIIAVPVRFKDRIAGVLALLRPDPDPDTHLRLVESIANLTGIAFDRALLYEDTVTKSDEIQHRNKELDDFTYVVSHDLKEPLITIEGYSKIILNEYRDRVDEEGKGYLNSIVQSSQRMKHLIDDLLTLSRIGRVSEAQETLPMGTVIEAVLRDFEFTLKENRSAVNIPPNLPTVRYNRTQLGMVFRNLIANAMKFNRSDSPRIDIDVKEGEQEYTIGVRDNGIGIDRRHFDKIFVIFQRLHRTEDFRGTGAGLTIVKKIVENHHGRIWVESAVGEGTTFYFTIPK